MLTCNLQCQAALLPDVLCQPLCLLMYSESVKTVFPVHCHLGFHFRILQTFLHLLIPL